LIFENIPETPMISESQMDIRISNLTKYTIYTVGFIIKKNFLFTAEFEFADLNLRFENIHLRSEYRWRFEYQDFIFEYPLSYFRALSRFQNSALRQLRQSKKIFFFFF